MTMTNDLVPYEELLKYKAGMKNTQVSLFLDYVKSEIEKACDVNENNIFLTLKRDENNDPDAISQRYIIYPKHPTDKIQKFVQEKGPFSLYVKM